MHVNIGNLVMALLLVQTISAKSKGKKNHPKEEDTTVPSPFDLTGLREKPDDVQVGCKELRSKRYISDGYCTSIKPISEVVCSGHCLPLDRLPWYAELVKVWSRTKILNYKCVEDSIRRRKIRLHCEDGSTRAYKIKVVKSCKCKELTPEHNRSFRRTPDL